ncbi:hypothetical protein PoB_003230300 [Plakobranchus ocellatus]|uniref:Uncharacterized protein n=1 Tax=Plakobranchus ocellatus TaxID=259542 RepID=A0AAV4AEV8_9GAST|nr:hypothetical protein PoB_003230300 [Plakobranchus ocellatus]
MVYVLEQAASTQDLNYLRNITACSGTASSDRDYFLNNVTYFAVSSATCLTYFYHTEGYDDCLRIINNITSVFIDVKLVGVAELTAFNDDFQALETIVTSCYDEATYLWWALASAYVLLIDILPKVSEELILCTALTHAQLVSSGGEYASCDVSQTSSTAELTSRHAELCGELNTHLYRLVYYIGRGLANSANWDIPASTGRK